MKQSLLIVQLVISIALVALIMMQSKGTGLGRSFGSTSYHSRRGLETLVFRLTIILTVVFVVVSVVSQILL